MSTKLKWQVQWKDKASKTDSSAGCLRDFMSLQKNQVFQIKKENTIKRKHVTVAVSCSLYDIQLTLHANRVSDMTFKQTHVPLTEGRTGQKLCLRTSVYSLLSSDAVWGG